MESTSIQFNTIGPLSRKSLEAMDVKENKFGEAATNLLRGNLRVDVFLELNEDAQIYDQNAGAVSIMQPTTGYHIDAMA